jgi:5-methylcytosine-specific restriction protein B
MRKETVDIRQAIEGFDRSEVAAAVRDYGQQIDEMRRRFPASAWPTMRLEDYALGHENAENSFCRWCEFKATAVGSIRGGSAQKLIIFKRKSKPGWYFPSQFPDVEAAWKELRQGFVRSLELAAEGKWVEIEELVQMHNGPAIGTKMLHLYFDRDTLPVFSAQHLRHFLEAVGQAPDQEGTLTLNRRLLAALREIDQLQDWSTKELERLLYQWADPRESRRVYKIAPGEGAEYWDDCLAGGFICVGWSEVGDLSLFESKEEFREEFRKHFTYKTKSKESAKANEVWCLRDLEPGDLVIANKGISTILAVGEVVEPGYVWRPDRAFKHTVTVRWDTSYAKTIAPQAHWATVTVAKVAPQLQELILARRQGAQPVVSVKPPVDETVHRIAAAVERKKQAILYGPPGTGKTYHARRFSVWWLLNRQGRADAAEVLLDRERFEQEERRLSTSDIAGRVWWIVANPKEWNWDDLFRDGKVDFRFGRLQKNYKAVQKGDWVLGYQSAPDKRIVAVARISREFSSIGGADPNISLEAVAKVANGLTYDELVADPILSESEPLRFRNQGTLFALNEREATKAVALLSERNPSLKCWDEIEAGDGDGAVGALTRVSFHASYAYEDFVEGFRPVDSGQAGITLRLDDGVFKRVCRAAAANPTRDYLILVDEINRANVAKVMGELLTLLEEDKRGLTVTLPQSKQAFSVPANVYLLGTMNTADRSIKLLDAALRRRFAFLEMMPELDLLAGATVGDLELDEFLGNLNQAVARAEGREKQIGHSYLLGKDGRPISTVEELAVRFRQEILPLLQEYSYDDYKTLTDILGPELVDQAGGLNTDVLDDDAQLVGALARRFSLSTQV